MFVMYVKYKIPFQKLLKNNCIICILSKMSNFYSKQLNILIISELELHYRIISSIFVCVLKIIRLSFGFFT